MDTVDFWIADRLYGVEARHVLRVHPQGRVTPVPWMPPFYLGLTYFRGEVYDVIHLRGLLCRELPACKPQGAMLLVRWSNRQLALVPDRLAGLLSETQSHPPADGARVPLPEPLVLDQLWQTLGRHVPRHFEI